MNSLRNIIDRLHESRELLSENIRWNYSESRDMLVVIVSCSEYDMYNTNKDLSYTRLQSLADERARRKRPDLERSNTSQNQPSDQRYISKTGERRIKWKFTYVKPLKNK